MMPELDLIVAAILGGVVTVFSQFILHIAQDQWDNRHDKNKTNLLKKLLEDKQYEWRSIKTLSAVIGESEQETKRLLLQINARGSENADDLWSLIDRNPIPKRQ